LWFDERTLRVQRVTDIDFMDMGLGGISGYFRGLKSFAHKAKVSHTGNILSDC